jgi:hypothetical protein
MIYLIGIAYVVAGAWLGWWLGGMASKAWER